MPDARGSRRLLARFSELWAQLQGDERVRLARLVVREVVYDVQADRSGRVVWRLHPLAFDADASEDGVTIEDEFDFSPRGRETRIGKPRSRARGLRVLPRSSPWP